MQFGRNNAHQPPVAYRDNSSALGQKGESPNHIADPPATVTQLTRRNRAAITQEEESSDESSDDSEEDHEYPGPLASNTRNKKMLRGIREPGLREL
eukprot:IDg2934t1